MKIKWKFNLFISKTNKADLKFQIFFCLLDFFLSFDQILDSWLIVEPNIKLASTQPKIFNWNWAIRETAKLKKHQSIELNCIEPKVFHNVFTQSLLKVILNQIIVCVGSEFWFCIANQNQNQNELQALLCLT